MKKPVLVLHGGTGSRPDGKRLARIRRGLRAICKEAYEYLQDHTALDSVIYAVRLLEDDPVFNASTGSYLQRDGKVRMSASVMDGDRLRFSAVLNIERVKNPVLVAQTLLEGSDRIVAGSHATSMARRLGFLCGTRSPRSACVTGRNDWPTRTSAGRSAPSRWIATAVWLRRPQPAARDLSSRAA